MGIRNIAENILKKGLGDVLDPEIWRTFSDYTDIETKGLTLPVEFIQAYTEQLQYRLHKCSRCVEAKKCIGYDTNGCSCNMPARAIVPNAKCSEERWTGMLSPEEWEQFKKERNISIEVNEL